MRPLIYSRGWLISTQTATAAAGAHLFSAHQASRSAAAVTSAAATSQETGSTPANERCSPSCWSTDAIFPTAAIAAAPPEPRVTPRIAEAAGGER